MIERAPLSPHDVVITRTVAKFGNTSYPIAAISSVSVQHEEATNKHFSFNWAPSDTCSLGDWLF